MARSMQIFEQTHRTCHQKKRQSKAGPQPYRGSRSTTLIDSPIAKKPDPFTQNAWHALTASCHYAHPTVAVRRVREKIYVIWFLVSVNYLSVVTPLDQPQFHRILFISALDVAAQPVGR